MGVVSLFIHSKLALRARRRECPVLPSKAVAFKLFIHYISHLIYDILLQIQTLSRTETFECSDFSSGRVDIAKIDIWTGGFSGVTGSGVWIETRDTVSSCGGNLDSICSGPGLFTGVGDIGSEEQRRALLWSWWRWITRPSSNFIKKDTASIASQTCPASHPGQLLKFWAKTS